MLMVVMLLVFVVSYLLMLGLVNFAEGVIDKGLQGKWPSVNPSGPCRGRQARLQ